MQNKIASERGEEGGRGGRKRREWESGRVELQVWRRSVWDSGTSPESTFTAGGLIGTFPSTRPEEGVASCRLYDSRLAYCPDSHLGCVMMIL